MTDKARSWVAAIYLAACLLLGGASAAGAIGNGLLQLVAIVIIVMSLWETRIDRVPGEAKPLIWLTAAFILIGILSLIPLPAELWTALPGRDPIARGFTLFGTGLPDLPLSLAPGKSVGALLSVLPPVAMLLLVMRLPEQSRRRLVWVVLAIATVSIALGTFQLLGGERSALRPYRITNPTLPVGLFANVNHFVTLLLCALPLTGYLAARAFANRKGHAGKGSGPLFAVAIAAFLVVGIATTGSLAGYGLLVPALGASYLVYRRAANDRIPKGITALLGVLFALFLVAALVGPLNDQALSNKFDDNPTSRKVIAGTSIRAAKEFFPLGSGLGTFQELYRTFDDPNRLGREYVNHAHNDYLEIALELGIPGLLIVIGFILWWIRQVARIWPSDFKGAALARGGTVMIGLILFHSVVDYPLRTAAIAALLALACGFVLPPAVSQAAARKSRRRDRSAPLRHLEAE